MNLKNLLEGLPIQILSKNTLLVDKCPFSRADIRQWADDTGNPTTRRLGYRLILKLMDEYEEPKEEKPSDPFAGRHWNFSKEQAVDGSFSHKCIQDLAAEVRQIREKKSELKIDPSFEDAEGQ